MKNLFPDRIVKAGGGCCDCGDEDAWKPSGFCKKHSGNSTEMDLATILPNNVIKSSLRVIERLLYWMVKNMSRSVINTNEATTCNAKLLAITKFMDTFCKSFGDPFKRLLTLKMKEEFIDFSELNSFRSEKQSQQQKVSPLEFLFLVDNKLHSIIQKAFHNLYFALIGDIEFKKAFGCLFSKYFNIIYEESKEKEKWAQSLIHFSVQILTVTSLAPSLCSEYNIFQNILKPINQILATHQKKFVQDERSVIQFGENIFNTRIYTLSNDFGYLVKQTPVSNLLLTQKKDFRLFLEVLNKFQACFLLKRKFGEHVLFDKSNEYNDLFSVIMELISPNIFPIFSSIFKENGNHTDQKFLNQVLYVSSKLISSFEEYSKKVNWEWNKKTKENPRMINYSPLKNNITPFLPLQRSLSIFISQYFSLCEQKSLSLHDFFKDVQSDTVSQMLQEIINFYIFLFQSQSNLWVKTHFSSFYFPFYSNIKKGEKWRNFSHFGCWLQVQKFPFLPNRL